MRGGVRPQDVRLPVAGGKKNMRGSRIQHGGQTEIPVRQSEQQADCDINADCRPTRQRGSL